MTHMIETIGIVLLFILLFIAWFIAIVSLLLSASGFTDKKILRAWLNR